GPAGPREFHGEYRRPAVAGRSKQAAYADRLRRSQQIRARRFLSGKTDLQRGGGCRQRGQCVEKVSARRREKREEFVGAGEGGLGEVQIPRGLWNHGS